MRIDKYKVWELFNKVPLDMEIEIIITRTMNDKISFYNYELKYVSLSDDYIQYSYKDKRWKIRYDNIIKIEWKPIFKELINKTNIIIDGEYNE